MLFSRAADGNDQVKLVTPVSILVPENSPVNHTAYAIVFSDDDTVDSYEYSILAGANGTWDNANINRHGVAVGSAFAMRGNSSNLLPLTPINFEAKPFFRIAIQVLDYSPLYPQLQNTTTIVNVTLIDMNDPPELLPLPYIYNVSENVPVGSLVVMLPGFDEDPADVGECLALQLELCGVEWMSVCHPPHYVVVVCSDVCADVAAVPLLHRGFAHWRGDNHTQH